MARQKPPPKFLNLLLIKLPPGGVASIAHRISGVLMFLSIPPAAWLFGLSLDGGEGFERAREVLYSPLLQLVSIVLVWSLSHHLLAGVRHLLLDIGVGVDRMPAQRSALLVNVAAMVVTGIYLGSLVI